MKKSEYIEHVNNFLKVMEILRSQNNSFALARAFKKPMKWYGQYTVQEAVEILQAEASNKNR